VLIWATSLKKRVGEDKYNELKRAGDSFILTVFGDVLGFRLGMLDF